MLVMDRTWFGQEVTGMTEVHTPSPYDSAVRSTPYVRYIRNVCISTVLIHELKVPVYWSSSVIKQYCSVQVVMGAQG
jgi:hypothetical protein